MNFTKSIAVIALSVATIGAHADEATGNQLAQCAGVFATIAKVTRDNGGSQSDVQSNARLSTAFTKTAALHLGQARAEDMGARMYGGLIAAIQANKPNVANDVQRFQSSCVDLAKITNVGRFL